MANHEVKLLEEKTYSDPNPNIKMGSYLIRESYYQYMIHSQDVIKNVGYQWRPNLMTKSLSSYLQSNTDVSEMVNQYRKLLVYLVDTIQEIKKAYNYTVDKHFRYVS